jgi:hypothetical protein
MFPLCGGETPPPSQSWKAGSEQEDKPEARAASGATTTMSGNSVWKPFKKFEYQNLLPADLRAKVRAP